MGYESYKLTAKFKNVTGEFMKKELIELGATFVEQFGNYTTLKMTYESGNVTIILSEAKHLNVDFSPCDKVQMSILFSKTSDSRIARQIVLLLHILSQRHETVYIRDEVTNTDYNFDDLKESIQRAQREFYAYYPKLTSDEVSSVTYDCMGMQTYVSKVG